jgi:hypothetical protein
VITSASCCLPPFLGITLGAKPSPEKVKLGPDWNHVVRRGRVVKAESTPSPAPTSSDTVRRSERQAAPAGCQCKNVRMVESQPLRSKQTDSTLPPHHRVNHRSRDRRSPGEPSYQGLHRVDTPSSLPTGDARPRAVPKTVIVHSSV